MMEAADHHIAGRLAEAEAGYRRVLAWAPDHADALHLLGVLLAQRGEAVVAVDMIRRAIGRRQGVADYHANLGNALLLAGKPEAAVASLRTAVTLRPDHADAWTNLGGILAEHGQAEEGEQAARTALALAPNRADALHHLGMALAGQGRHQEAAECFARAVAVRPGLLDARIRLAGTLATLGDAAGAVDAYRGALGLAPTRADLHLSVGLLLWQLRRVDGAATHLERVRALLQADNPASGSGTSGSSIGCQAERTLGAVRHAQRRFPEAVVCFRAVLANPAATVAEQVESWFNLGKTLGDQGEIAEAADAYGRALILDPIHPLSLLNVALLELNRDNLKEAIAYYQRLVAAHPDHAAGQLGLGLAWRIARAPGPALQALEAAWRLNPDDSETVRSLAGAQRDLGLCSLAAARLRDYLDRHPDEAEIHRALLLAQVYDPEETPERRLAEHRRYGVLHVPPPASPPVFANVRDPERRLRIGYMSSDLRRHVIASNLLPVAETHDRERFAIHYYADVRRPDDTTARFQAVADGWHPIAGCSDAEVAAQIRADGIDILVCLAAHFDGNRPLVCARRPAPVQVSFHDVLTSGVGAIDYFIGDPVLCPRQGGDQFVERVIRLPSFYVAAPPLAVPEPVTRPNPLPGPPMFGSFNNPSKIGPPVLDLWARLLAAVPEASIFFKYLHFYADHGLRERVTSAFARHGVRHDRLMFASGQDNDQEYYSRYREIDVALDPFPMSGSTTTFDALAMGVPVVTLPQAEMASRWTACMLRPLGLQQWIAADADSYIALNVVLIRDRAALDHWRRTLRARLIASPLCNAPLKARQLERIYRGVWRRWCKEAGAGPV